MVHLYALNGPMRDTISQAMRISKVDVGQRFDLDLMDSNTRYGLTAANLRRLDTTGHREFEQNFAALKREFHRWMSAFATLQPVECDDAAHSMARIHFFSMWLFVESLCDASECAMDRFQTQFEHLTSVCEAYILKFWSVEPHIPLDPRLPRANTSPAFTLGSGLLNCLSIIALRCRDNSIRQRCIRLLRQLNFQGTFDSFYLAGMVEAVVEIEENRARELIGIPEWVDFKCYEVPEGARVLNVELEMGGDDDKHTFYKKDFGSFVYHTWSEGLGSELQRGEGVFLVNRPLPSGQVGRHWRWFGIEDIEMFGVTDPHLARRSKQ